jgi:hypothetical protein
VPLLDGLNKDRIPSEVNGFWYLYFVLIAQSLLIHKEALMQMVMWFVTLFDVFISNVLKESWLAKMVARVDLKCRWNDS